MTRATADVTSDDLGEVAEAEVALLCAKARLICNKSQRDRTGWDFIIEFPTPSFDPAEPLDARPSGASCHAQVKGTAAGDRIALRLSAAERLAKDPKPAFVIAVRLDRSGKALSGYLIHLLDAPLAKILKRLRRAHAQGRHDINHMQISLDMRSSGMRFAWTPDGLRSALAQACGPDPGAYVQRKRGQLEELGYESGRFQLDTTFSVADRGEAIDVLLGLKPFVATSLKTFDTRFGIRLPLDVYGSKDEVEVWFKPDAFAACAVTFTGATLRAPAVFHGDAYRPPLAAVFSENDAKMLVRAGPFLVTISGAALRFETQFSLTEDSRSLSEWLNLFRALEHVSQPGGAITIKPHGPFEPFTVTLDRRPDNPLLGDSPKLVRVMQEAARILDLVGLADSPELPFATIVDAGQDIRLAAGVLLDSPADIGITIDLERPLETGDRCEFFYANYFDWRSQRIVYAAKLAFQRETAGGLAMRLETVEPLAVEAMNPDAFLPWVECRAAGAGLENIIRPDGADAPPP